MSENRKKFTWRHVFLLWLLCAEVLTVAILLIQRDDLDWSLEKADMMYKKVSEKYDPYNEFSPARNEEGQ